MFQGKTYLSVNAVAELLGVHERTIKRWIEKVKIGRVSAGFEDVVLLENPISGDYYFEEKSFLEVINGPLYRPKSFAEIQAENRKKRQR
jgi:hypothetical protein